MCLSTNEGAPIARPTSYRSPSEALHEISSQGHPVSGSRQGVIQHRHRLPHRVRSTTAVTEAAAAQPPPFRPVGRHRIKQEAGILTEPDPPLTEPEPEPEPEPGDSCNDAATLLSIKDELRGTGTLNWSATLPLGRWQGVQSSVGCVSRLNLNYNQLTGSIPDSLGNLANLEILSFSLNQLTGSIPDSLGNLANLDWLNLHGNQLTGSIPVSLGNLANLSHLNLHGTS